MTDYSNSVAWAPVAVGIVVSIVAGRYLGRIGWGVILAAAFLAMVLGVVLIFATAVAHGFCVESGLCADRGERNMEYWFHGFFAIPVFFAVMLLVPYRGDPVPAQGTARPWPPKQPRR